MSKTDLKVAVLTTALLCGATHAYATVYSVPITGTLSGSSQDLTTKIYSPFTTTFSATLLLTVVGGQAVSGGGNFTSAGLGLTNASLALITAATPGNETAGGPSAPVGFRDNFGTDLFGADTAYPIDGNGLLFDVGTKTAAAGQFPLLAVGNGPNDTIFTGTIGKTEFYVEQGTSDIGPGSVVSSVPEPSTWAMVLLGFGGLGLLACRKARKSDADAEMLAA